MNRLRTHPRGRVTAGTMVAATLTLLTTVCAFTVTTAHAQSATPAPGAALPASASAAALLRQCKDTDNATAQALCIGTVRGIVHGYQYGVLLVGNRNNVDEQQLKLVSLCINGVRTQTLVDEFVTDAATASAEDLANTDAETVVLGSIHEHHGCQ